MAGREIGITVRVFARQCKCTMRRARARAFSGRYMHRSACHHTPVSMKINVNSQGSFRLSPGRDALQFSMIESCARSYTTTMGASAGPLKDLRAGIVAISSASHEAILFRITVDLRINSGRRMSARYNKQNRERHRRARARERDREGGRERADIHISRLAAFDIRTR